MEIILIILGVIFLLVLILGGIYNGLLRTRNLVKNQWSQIDVQIKMRADLIPNLVETVKGYASHEKETLDAVMKARSKAVGANTKEEEIKANSELEGALGRLMVVVEAYPDLKANEGFRDLQRQLATIEEKIAFARQFYNDATTKYNTKISVFPTFIFARMFGFTEEMLITATEKERVVPKVQF